VWLWSEWPGAWAADAGIDLVAEERDGRLWAIQAKAYDSSYAIKKADVDSFLSESSRPQFSYRLLIATTDRLGSTARRTLDSQREPVGYLLRSQLELAQVSWPTSPDDLRPRRPARKKPLPHVREAIQATVRGFADQQRGHSQGLCRRSAARPDSNAQTSRCRDGRENAERSRRHAQVHTAEGYSRPRTPAGRSPSGSAGNSVQPRFGLEHRGGERPCHYGCESRLAEASKAQPLAEAATSTHGEIRTSMSKVRPPIPGNATPTSESRTVCSVDLFTLLTAITTRGQDEAAPYRTSTAIARRLSMSPAEVEAALRDAERQGLVVEEQDESHHVGADFDRQFWRLSDAGREEFRRLEDARRKQ
jgi:Restriction endonuclease